MIPLPGRERTTVVMGLLIVALAWCGWRICQQVSPRNVTAVGSIVTMQTYRCENCGAEFTMDWAERRKMGDTGRVVIGSDGMARQPCPTCGQVRARIKVGADTLEPGRVN